MNNGNPQDLLGFCGIESEKLARDLCEIIRPGYYEIAKFIDGSDIRGIDTCLVYSKGIFECIETKSFRINFRYPTRDIFLARLRIKENNAEMLVLVNHGRLGEEKKMDSTNMTQNFQDAWLQKTMGELLMIC
jgi:endonuclease/exonuclease/phosphatase family protein